MIEKIKELIKRWGEGVQLVIAMEQCAQLSTEISHELRWGNNRSNIINRIADMLIMIETLKIMFRIKDYEIERIQMTKIEKALNVDGWEKEAK